MERDEKRRIKTADNIKVRPEKHPLKRGEIYNPRHHGQHYHIHTRRNPKDKSNDNENIEIIKPPNYKPKAGTGFLPGETFPGII